MICIVPIIELFVSAGLLGVIIAAMEDRRFPGWLPMIVCVLAAGIPGTAINLMLPDYLFFVGLTVGAICAGLAISYMCSMSVKRATIAAFIYLVIRICIGLILVFIVKIDQ